MSLSLFIIFVSVFTPLIIWALKNEDRLIDIEDKIIEVIKNSKTENAAKPEIYIVKQGQSRRNPPDCTKQNFVA